MAVLCLSLTHRARNQTDTLIEMHHCQCKCASLVSEQQRSRLHLHSHVSILALSLSLLGLQLSFQFSSLFPPLLGHTFLVHETVLTQRSRFVALMTDSCFFTLLAFALGLALAFGATHASSVDIHGHMGARLPHEEDPPLRLSFASHLLHYACHSLTALELVNSGSQIQHVDLQ